MTVVKVVTVTDEVIVGMEVGVTVVVTRDVEVAVTFAVIVIVDAGAETLLKDSQYI